MSEETIEMQADAVQNNPSVQEIAGEAQQPVETLTPVSEEPSSATAKPQVFIPVKKGRPILHKLEEVIEKGYREFWSVGEALWEIREKKLFAERYSGQNYASFGDYLPGRWGYRSRGYQLMEASQVRRLMIDELDIKNPDSICPSERQYRENAGIIKLAENGKLQDLKAALSERKELTAELLQEKAQSLLPVKGRKRSKAMQGKPELQKRQLEKKLERIRNVFTKKVVKIRLDYPAFKDVIDEWLKGLATPSSERV